VCHCPRAEMVTEWNFQTKFHSRILKWNFLTEFPNRKNFYSVWNSVWKFHLEILFGNFFGNGKFHLEIFVWKFRLQMFVWKFSFANFVWKTDRRTDRPTKRLVEAPSRSLKILMQMTNQVKIKMWWLDLMQVAKIIRLST